MKYQEFAISDKLNNSAFWRDKNENEVKWFNWNSTAFKNENHAKMSANGLWFKLNKPEDIEVICQQDLSYEKKLGQIRYEQLVSLTRRDRPRDPHCYGLSLCRVALKNYVIKRN